MNNAKFYTNQLPKDLNISRTKLYELFKQLGIKPQKEGRKGYVNHDQLEQIKEKINSSEVSEHIGNINEKESIIIQTLKKEHAREREELKAELEAEREKNVKIAYQLGQAQTEHQHTRDELLRLQSIPEAPEPIKKSWWQVWK